MNRKWLLAALCAASLGGIARAEVPATQDAKSACAAPSPAQAEAGPVSGTGPDESGIQLTDPMDYPGGRSNMEMGRQDWDYRIGTSAEHTGIGATDHDRLTSARRKPHRIDH